MGGKKFVGQVRSVNNHRPDLLSTIVALNGRGPESDHFFNTASHMVKYACLCYWIGNKHQCDEAYMIGGNDIEIQNQQTFSLRNSAFLTIVE